MATSFHQRTSFHTLAPETIAQIWAALDRKSKTALLTVSKGWRTEAEGNKFLWTNIAFGPKSQKTDLDVAKNWIERSAPLMLSVAISRDPSKIEGSNGFPSTLAPLSLIFNLVVAEFGRIKALHIDGPHTNAELISDLLQQHSFPHLENHFMTIVHDGAPAVTTMANHPPIFLPLDLQSLLSLHLSNFPTIWPIAMPSGIRITELVLGKMSEFRPSLSELKQAWESTPLMERLGFYRQIAGLSLEDLLVDTSITLPSLTTLSLCHTPPGYLLPLLSVLDIPKFSDLTIALDARYAAAEDDGPLQLISHLHNPVIAPRIRTLAQPTGETMPRVESLFERGGVKPPNTSPTVQSETEFELCSICLNGDFTTAFPNHTQSAPRHGLTEPGSKPVRQCKAKCSSKPARDL
ncbi:hypothetical protein B0H10DRAFT_1959931 [Mycena sp. CBHHK59/15]|nr:hypothetical protein B0H10DRAFT_1959931 [Mycena sp. CBHHK59/15]